MVMATLTSKGQITLPKIVRDELGLTAGKTVDFVRTIDGYKIVSISRDVRALKGVFAGRVSRPVSLEAMDKAIKRSVNARLIKAKP
jgi:antitoxin PrlF